MDKLLIIFLLIAGYLVGSIPFAAIISRMKGVDIRNVGSKNPGAANVFRAVGKPYGIIVWILDMCKSLVVMFISDRIFHVQLFIIFLVGIAAVAGHCWSIFMRFRGGKGVATSGGVFLYLLPWAFPIVLIAYFLIQKKARSIPVVVSGFFISLSLIFLIYRYEWKWLAPGMAIFLVLAGIANMEAIKEMRRLAMREKAK